jgi:hypothetical protein
VDRDAAVTRTLVWRGLDEPRMEIAYVEPSLRARGTQVGACYELRYELGDSLRVEIVGGTAKDVPLDGDFFDLGFSPLFNTLPVLADGLHRGGEPRVYVMTWVSVPDLEVFRSEQRYEPLGDGVVRFSADEFTADVEFDEDGFVVRYPGLAERVG